MELTVQCKVCGRLVEPHVVDGVSVLICPPCDRTRCSCGEIDVSGRAKRCRRCGRDLRLDRPE